MKLIKIFNTICNYLVLKRFGVKKGKSVVIGGRLLVKGTNESVSIGNNTIINSDKTAVPLGFQNQTVFWTIGEGQIFIGSNCGITNTSFCSASQIVIEDYVTIGGGVKIFDTDFHSLSLEKRIDYANDNDRMTKPIIIKKGAFIGAGSIVLKGVSVGEEAIIGAGSVVTKSIPAGEVWAGNPAVFIRRLEEKYK